MFRAMFATNLAGLQYTQGCPLKAVDELSTTKPEL
jgi:hypothetical protein